MALKQNVLLTFVLEKEVDPKRLAQLASQLCWSMDKVATCDYANIDKLDIVITGEAPDGLVAHHLFATAATESTDEPTVVAFLWAKVTKMVKGWFSRD